MKNCLSLTLIIISLNCYSQVNENFDSWSDSSYGSTNTYGSWISNNAMCSSYNARSGNAVRLRNSSSSYLEYVGTDGNIILVSFMGQQPNCSL